MKKVWSVFVVLLCVVLLFSACGVQNTPDQPVQPETPKSPDEIFAGVFGDEPYSLSYTSAFDGDCYVSNIVFNPNCTEDYTLVIPAQPSNETAEKVTELHRSKYWAFRTVEAANVPCVMTEAAYQALIASMQTEGASNDQLIAALIVKDCYEQENLALAKNDKTERMLRYNFPLVDYTVIYNLKVDITPEELARLSDHLMTYASFTEADKKQVYEEVILLTRDHLEEEKHFASLWYLSNHSTKYMTAVELPGTLEEIKSGALAGCTRLENIRFAGSKAQWAAVEKGDGWNEGVPATVVHCTDGDVPINQ